MASIEDTTVKNAHADNVQDEPDAKKAKLDDGSGKPSHVVDNNNCEAARDDDKSANNSGTPSKNVSAGGSGAASSKANGNDVSKSDSRDLDDDEDVDSEDAEIFDPKVANALEVVEEIQDQITKLNEQASEEILKVEQKFNKLRRPHLEKRNALLREVPNFWLTSLANHPMIAPLIESAEDEDCLHYMVHLDVEEFEDIKSGYKLKFHFVENPYIENDIIIRELQHINSEEVVSGTTPLKFKDTPQGKNLKQVVERSISQGRRKGQTEGSFFGWLSQNCEGGTDEISEIIKDQVFPSPLEFFFSAPEDYGAGSDDDEDDDDDDDDDDESDDEEDYDADYIGNEIDPEMVGDENDILDDDLGNEDGDDDDLDDEEDEE